MARIDFCISNDGHHVAMLQPVMQLLAEKGGYQCRVVSLCEFRGIKTPFEKLNISGLSVTPVLSRRFRSSSSGGSQSGSRWSRIIRTVVRYTSWYGLLNRPLEAIWDDKPDLVVLPNDAAFPYNHIVRQLKKRRIPFVLVQEGIRFPLPSTAALDDGIYGAGGAAAVAAWGESSAAYFCQQGVPQDRIYLTGNPRFDHLNQVDWDSLAQEWRQKLSPGKKTLLFLSNPIDDQGFCTTKEKIELIARFVQQLEPLFNDEEFSLFIKLHGRESKSVLITSLQTLPYAGRITILQHEPLYPLFLIASAGVVMASTVGLEALLFGLPLAVLEIPGVGFVHDYVSEGAALGISWDKPISRQVAQLLECSMVEGKAKSYLKNNLAVQECSAQSVSGLLEKFLT